MDKTAVQIEILFNSLEIELARRWAFHDVPSVFVTRPPMHLRMIVKSWWHLYHESICARHQTDRSRWKRSTAYPAMALETTELVASLREIRRLLALDDLIAFRPLSTAEESSLCLLALLAEYYAKQNRELSIQTL